MSSTSCDETSCDFHSEITVPISDFVLTPISCASLINEVVKNLLYQRSQIPYPYSWMKNIVNKKRECSESYSETKRVNLTVTKHFKTVSNAYDDIEQVMKDIRDHFSNFTSNLKEVVFVFGVTPVCPKEVFVIKVLGLAEGHFEQNHILENNKKMQRTLRNIFLSQSWVDLIDGSISVTNVYIYIKLNCDLERDSCDIFLPSKPFVIPPKVKHTVINLEYPQNDNYLCCDNLNIFSDSSTVDNDQIHGKNDCVQIKADNDSECWLQSRIVFRGFKDCFINKIPASELW